MLRKCVKCNVKLDTESGSILIIYPVYFMGEFLEFILCREHFLEADRMNGKKFRKWIRKRSKK